MVQKLTVEEKKLIKAVVGYEKTKGYFPVEYEIMQITGERNTDHRELVEEYLKTLEK